MNWLAAFAAWAGLVIVAHVDTPTNEQIRDACREHGRTVNYVPTGWFSFTSRHKVICLDGSVLEIKR